MDEEDYWVRLEYRICAEFQGFDDPELRRNWCDGLVADEYALLSPQPCIRGRAWCGPGGQEPWRFTLLVGPDSPAREHIDWSVLLPGARLTGWLSPDNGRKTMVVDPLGGYPQ